MKTVQMMLLCLLPALSFGKASFYRLSWRSDPSASMVIGWNQVSGTDPAVYYDTVDHGDDQTAYRYSQRPDRVLQYRGMNNHFVRLENLAPDTAYYFVVCDSEGAGRRLWFRTAPAAPGPFTFIAGGDSRSNPEPRREGNKLVAKLRPLFVLFGGDYTGVGNPGQWQEWLEDWQLTISEDGRIYPIIATHGNHENADLQMMDKLFDTPHPDQYYSFGFAGDLMRVWVLNSELEYKDPEKVPEQQAWIEADLPRHADVRWKVAAYHRPMRPHTAGKKEGESRIAAWARLFYDHGMDLIVESDTHMVKRSYPVRPSEQAGSYESFVRDDENGMVFIGEGSWGAPTRPVNDDKPWTMASGSFHQFKWIQVSPEEMQIRTVRFDGADAVVPLTENRLFEEPENMQFWEPETGKILRLPFDASHPTFSAPADAWAGPYKPTVESLRHYKAPEWYQDAKFGVWAHWGVYSVPAFGGTHAAEWYPRHMYDASNANWHFEHHKNTYGPNTEFGYKDFIPMFKAEKFDPDAWMDLAVEAGARFYTVVAQHHDGFAMYDSDFTIWNSVDMGPKRDITGDLFEAARKRGLKTGVGNHFAFNLEYYEHMFSHGGDWKPKYKDLYGHGGDPDEWYMNRWWNRSWEIAEKYDPDLYYFDWGWNRPRLKKAFDGLRERFLAEYYNQAIEREHGTFGDPGVVVNFKGRTLPPECGVLDFERGGRDGISPLVWQCCTSISKHSWSYSTRDDYWSSNELVDSLIDVVSKNGVMMLNFGPRADGTIPDEYVSRLKEIGAWLKINGEAIYATRPFRVHGEGPTVRTPENRKQLHDHGYNYTAQDIRFTRSKDSRTLYIIALDWPQDGVLNVTTLRKGKFDAANISLVSMLGGAVSTDWNQDGAGLKIALPEKPASAYAHVFKVELKKELR